MPQHRLDLYTTIHKGIRALLFDTTAAAARVDTDSNEAVDDLVARVEQLVEFLDEHAAHEDRQVLPALRAVGPAVATKLEAEHRALDHLQRRVHAAAEALAVAAGDARADLGLTLIRLLNRLTAAHLEHMHREETEANYALWAGLTDNELLAIHLRIIGSIPPTRYEEWMAFALPAVNPGERLRMSGQAA